LEEMQIFWVLWDLGFYQICFSSVPANFCHHHMISGTALRLALDVMDLYSQSWSEWKITASNGGKSRWEKNQQCFTSSNG
jgi:hypothetical protein